MKTIKLIDLFVKIANEEETPNEIKFKGNIYTHNGIKGNSNYYCRKKSELLEDAFLLEYLNEEVEIIEDTPKEDKKIEKLDLQYKDIIYNPNFKANILMYCDNLQFKINEIIDKINGE